MPAINVVGAQDAHGVWYTAEAKNVPAKTANARDRLDRMQYRKLFDHEGSVFATHKQALPTKPTPTQLREPRVDQSRARYSEKSVQQNDDADSDLGMVFAARTGPLGSSVHFWEFSAGQDGCIRAGHTILVPRTPLTGDLGRRANPVRTKKRASHRTGPQNDVDLRNATRLQRHRQSSRC